MAVEERKCNGFVKLEDSSGEGLITYKRRKRARSSSDAGQVSHMPLHKGKIRDIGWEHGVIVDGNRFHWKCNWCGLVRYGGGVSRLKQHIAGTCHVQKCQKVPEDVAKNMMNHLITKQKDRRMKIAARKGIDKMKSKFHREDDLVGKDNVKVDLDMKGRNASQLSERATKQYGVASQRSRTATQRSRTTAQLFNIGMAKDMNEAHDTDLYSSTYDKDDHARIDSHWRQVLEHLLQLSDMSEGSGIQSCIRDALIYGPSGFTREFKRVDSPRDTTQPKDRPEGHNEVKSQSQILDGSTSDVSKTGTSDVNANTIKCQNVFLDILRSEKFALLCDLLCITLQDDKGKRFFDFSLINSKMKNGDYEKLPGSFDQDIQQVWDKFQKIGQEMVLLATGLSNVSRVSYQKRVGQNLINGASEHNPEETCRVVIEQKNSTESYTTIQLISCESDRSTKPDQTEASGLYKVCICKKCGTDVNGDRSLICDGCEAMYHYSCIEPAVEEIPSRSWHCSACHTNKREPSEPASAHTQPDSLHQDCAVCNQLEFSETQEENDSGSGTVVANDSRESSVSSMESDESPEMSGTAMSRLCKLCGTCEDEDKRFLICGHAHCPYKFYHIRCLKTSQIASVEQQNKPCWYCPSCLCRACLCDKDDDKIVLCDGCDEAYHTYCMKPPRTSIPKGHWYCVPCNVTRAKEGMRRYEQWILQQHRKNDVRQASEANRSMDLLLSAAEKLRSEEQLVAENQDK
ncbi:PHD finger protein EHD3-like isoform X2 [Phoenix dactylifera]|uniref:PHD finger protein EHD3-like isoform X2 n=1 Tax=Phoenix dactylifera TaxID=42345 RepID=A0A8B7BQJ5_PHODC|nr:PHD finger protein EHD3-like isoform X2 [Phoenix dactylifera]